jgi:hypothetical protein
MAQIIGNVTETRLCYTILISAHCSNHTQRPRVSPGPPIADNTHDEFLSPVLAPRLAAVALAQMRNILDYTKHRPAEPFFLFVVYGYDDEKLRPARQIAMCLAQGKPLVLEFLRIACYGRITDMCEFTLIALFTHVEQLCRYGGVEGNFAVEESVKLSIIPGDNMTLQT